MVWGHEDCTMKSNTEEILRANRNQLQSGFGFNKRVCQL